MDAQKAGTGAFAASDLRRLVTETGDGPMPSNSRPPSRTLLRLAETMGAIDPRPPVSAAVFVGLVRILECALLWVTSVLTYASLDDPPAGTFAVFVLLVGAVAAAALMVFQPLRLYRIGAFRHPLASLGRIAIAWPVVAGGAYAVVQVFGAGRVLTSAWLMTWLVCGFAVLAAERLLLSVVTGELTRRGRLKRRTVVVGGGKAGAELLEALREQPDADLRIYGVFDDRNDARSPDVVSGYPKLGTVDDLVTFARHTPVDLVIFTLPITAEERLLQMLRKLWVLPIDIRLAAHRNKLRFQPRSYSYIGAVPMLDVFDRPIADWDRVMKAVFDRAVGGLALIVLSPLLILTAVAIKLDSEGPVFFKQKRHGFNNENIDVYKFRSLYVDQTDALARTQVTRNDPRVTRVGRFIRKASIDELPQLFNVVFKGNLSLVGPRPHAVHAHLADRHYDDVVDSYFARHRVKPGMTGWAQVNGWRGETDTPLKIQKRVEHDLAYIENWSIFFDLYILCITPFALIKAENAY